MNRNSIKIKKDRLVLRLKQFDSLIVAFSGGVDSTFLLAVAHDIVNKDVVAITAESPIHPAREKEVAVRFARNSGIKHIVLQSREISRPEFVANRKERCYICKKFFFEDLIKTASEMGIKHIAHGANVDDLEDFRPGFAAAHEMGIVAPLIDAGLAKDEIRLLSKEMSLETWNSPSMACLATRIPYGSPITLKVLKMVEQAENVIGSLGFSTCRVRHHGTVARIEVNPEDLERILNKRIKPTIIRKFREIGFSHIAVDMEGYVQGSMNKVIQDERNLS